MRSPPSSEQEQFGAMLEGLFGEASPGRLPQPIREKAWKRFLELGLPTHHHEPYRYVKLSRLYGQSFQVAAPSQLTREQTHPFIEPGSEGSCLVFVNGRYQPRLSNTDALPKRLLVTTLSSAMTTYGAYLKNYWGKSTKSEMDPFAAVNTALNGDGAFVYLPPKTVVEVPIQFLHIVDAASIPTLMLPRIHTFVGPHSRAKFISTHATISQGSFFTHLLTEWAVEEGASINFVQKNTAPSDDGWIFAATRATLKQDGAFHSYSLTEGGVRQDYRVSLVGENAEALLNGIWQLQDHHEAHTHVYIDHQAPSCRSKQDFRGVLNDCSRSSFFGKIYVGPQAQKTDAYQSNHNLLLSDNAMAACLPHLEIFADDVKASHGATMGQLDAEQLFFLRARGIPDAAAKKLLVEGFLQEILQQMR